MFYYVTEFQFEKPTEILAESAGDLPLSDIFDLLVTDCYADADFLPDKYLLKPVRNALLFNQSGVFCEDAKLDRPAFKKVIAPAFRACREGKTDEGFFFQP